MKTLWLVCLACLLAWGATELLPHSSVETKEMMAKRHKTKRSPFYFDLHDVKRKDLVESRFHLQPGVRKYEQVPVKKDHIHKVTFAVKQRNAEHLHDILMSLSDPKSGIYGQHWSRERVAEFTSSPGAVNAIRTSLEHHGIVVESMSKYGEFITASAPISKWELIFNTKFYHFHDEVNDQLFVRALDYSMPEPLDPFVSAVVGVSDYFLDRSKNSKKHTKSLVKELLETYPMDISVRDTGTGATVNGPPSNQFGNNSAPWCVNVPLLHETIKFCMVYPELLYNYYNSSSPYGSAPATQAIFATDGQSFSPDDLINFQTVFNLTVMPIAGAYNGHVYYNACYVDSEFCDEASVDIQYITAMAQGTPTYFDYFYQSSSDLLLNWLLTIVNMTNPADVFSVSYSTYESYMYGGSMDMFNTEAMKLGIQGVTIVTGSGDGGANGDFASTNYCVYSPTFPSTSPYVTSVGATQGPEAGKPEVTCQLPISMITSGGGFSSAFYYNYNTYEYLIVNPIPSWQQEVVAEYLVSVGQFATYGYGTGRGYPDVSMMGNNYFYAENGTYSIMSGTAASAVVMAGVISQANSLRKQKGMSSLGFVNPLLYQYSNMFVKDITEGDNQCSIANNITIVGDTMEFSGTCCETGFMAAPGWDPVTGLGSVDVSKFLTVAMSFVASGAPSMAPTLPPPATAALYNLEKNLNITLGSSEIFAMDGVGENFLISNYSSKFVWQATAPLTNPFTYVGWSPSTLCEYDYCFFPEVAVMSKDAANRFVGGYENGFYSMDYGITWAPSTFPSSSYMYHVASSSTNQVILTAYDYVVYMSQDYGANFTPTLQVDLSSSIYTYYCALGVSPNGQILVAGHNYGVNVSVDAGATWYVSTGLDYMGSIPSNIAVANDLIIVIGYYGQGVYSSSDLGQSFTQVSYISSSVYGISSTMDLNRIVIYQYSYMGYGFYVSNDRGITFVPMGMDGSSADTLYTYGVSRFAVDAYNATTIGILRYDGGVSRGSIGWDFTFTSSPSAAPTTGRPSFAPTTAFPSIEPSHKPTETPSLIPTHNPTRAPTCIPSAVPTVQTMPALTFTSTLSVMGVSATDNAGVYTLSPEQLITLSDAAAVSMSLATNLVSVTSYSVAVGVASSNPQVNRAGYMRKSVAATTTLATVSVVLSTSVLVLPGQDSTALYNSLTTSLTNAVEVTGLYNVFMQAFASQEGVSSSFVDASATSVNSGGSSISIPVTPSPTFSPTVTPTAIPTMAPSDSPVPTMVPTALPTYTPSVVPTALPTYAPSITPSATPSAIPTWNPTYEPSMTPSVTPTMSPSVLPTVSPSPLPTMEPTAPTRAPTGFSPASATVVTKTQTASSGVISGAVIGGLIGLSILLGMAFYSGYFMAKRNSGGMASRNEDSTPVEMEIPTVVNPAFKNTGSSNNSA